ncbi:MAG TPA: lytic transglycosylase domain-containing protein, partial [Candidatus Binatia bacterium]
SVRYMMTRTIRWLHRLLLVACFVASVNSVAAQSRSSKHKTRQAKPAAEKTTAVDENVAQAKIIGKQIHFSDGSIVQADDVWKNGDDLWYRSGGVTQRVARAVKSVEPIRAPTEKPAETAEASAAAADSKPPAPDAFWVLLKGGARMKVDDVIESEEGAWCRRGNFSVLIAGDRIERIERESVLERQPGWKRRDWTTGSDRIDQLIRANGNRFGVDPYLVFCVIEHESQFRTKAVSPKGAQGLMQLMPGTASRFGVRNSFDAAQNIYGGTQYLKELLKMFGGRIDLALASYNAGEGAVLKYGRTVPPYRETREYVRRLTRRYGAADDATEKTSPSPR